MESPFCPVVGFVFRLIELKHPPHRCGLGDDSLRTNNNDCSAMVVINVAIQDLLVTHTVLLYYRLDRPWRIRAPCQGFIGSGIQHYPRRESGGTLTPSRRAEGRTHWSHAAISCSSPAPSINSCSGPSCQSHQERTASSKFTAGSEATLRRSFGRVSTPM